MSLCTTAHPLHTRYTKIFGTSVSETTMRPNPRCALNPSPASPALTSLHQIHHVLAYILQPFCHEAPTFYDLSAPTYAGAKTAGRSGARSDGEVAPFCAVCCCACDALGCSRALPPLANDRRAPVAPRDEVRLSPNAQYSGSPYDERAWGRGPCLLDTPPHIISNPIRR